MTRTELLEKVSSLEQLLKCLSEVGDNNPIVLQGMPQALKVASDYVESIFEALANEEVEFK